MDIFNTKFHPCSRVTQGTVKMLMMNEVCDMNEKGGCRRSEDKEDR